MSVLRTAMGALLSRVPLAGGRIVKELAQSIDRVGAHVERRARRSFFGRLAATLTGRGRQERDAISRGLVRNQREIVAELDELRTHGIALDIDVARVAGHLRQVQAIALHGHELARATAADLAELATTTSEIAHVLSLCQEQINSHTAVTEQHAQALAAHARRLADLEARVAVTELRLAADDVFTVLTERWLDGESYSGLPWLCQVVLLAQETATGMCGGYELVAAERWSSGGSDLVDPSWFRKRLVRTIMKNLPSVGPWEGNRSVVDLYLELARQFDDGDQALMVAEVLGVGLRPDAPSGPLTTSLARHLDATAQRGSDGCERETARRAFADATRVRWMPARITVPGFVESVVSEQAEHALAVRRSLWPAAGAPGATSGGVEA